MSLVSTLKHNTYTQSTILKLHPKQSVFYTFRYAYYNYHYTVKIPIEQTNLNPEKL